MTKTKNPLKAILIGCGRISKNHFSSLQNNKKINLIAVCDKDENKMQSVNKFFPNIKKYNNLSDAIQMEPNLDIAILCTPSGIHSEQAIFLLNNNIHVITEKPMATSILDAKRMLEAAELSKGRLFTVKQNRLNKTIKALKNYLESGFFGKIYFVSSNVFWSRPQSYYDEASWRGTKKMDGGAFLNQGSHYFDLLIWLFGDVEKIASFTETLERNIEMEDSGTAIIKFKNNILANINVTMLTSPRNYEGSITIISEKGTIEVGGKALNKIIYCDIEPFASSIKNLSYDIENIYGYGHSLFYDEVLSSLISEKKSIFEGGQGFKSLELIMNAYKSQINQEVIFY